MSYIIQLVNPLSNMVFELGIPLETLEYCIGQSMKSNRPIFNYVRIMRKHADEAIRKILDNLK